VVAAAARVVDAEETPTPALLVDRRALAANIEGMADRTASFGVALRPHAKTHKSIAIATLQRESGAAGLTVATMREAETFAAAGFDDLLITNPPVGKWRIDRLVELARRARVRVALDAIAAVEDLDRACSAAGVEIGYLWEVDCGVGRFGTEPGEATAMVIGDAIAASRTCSFGGLMAFGGHAYQAADDQALADAASDERLSVVETAAALAARGIETPVRSIGTTPTAHALTSAEGISEFRPGNYVFYDATQVALGLVGIERCALTVLATVVSRPSRTRLVLDCGSKALAAEQISPRTAGFGIVRGHPELRVVRLFEEQAVVAIDGACDLGLGDRVEVVPNHSCAALNLHERMLVVDSGQVVDSWSVNVRGWDRTDSYVERTRVSLSRGAR
jgi:D-serine deaminase-like pyridoxal phosphate-dependent protein